MSNQLVHYVPPKLSKMAIYGGADKSVLKYAKQKTEINKAAIEAAEAAVVHDYIRGGEIETLGGISGGWFETDGEKAAEILDKRKVTASKDDIAFANTMLVKEAAARGIDNWEAEREY